MGHLDGRGRARTGQSAMVCTGGRKFETHFHAPGFKTRSVSLAQVGRRHVSRLGSVAGAKGSFESDWAVEQSEHDTRTPPVDTEAPGEVRHGKIIWNF